MPPSPRDAPDIRGPSGRLQSRLYGRSDIQAWLFEAQAGRCQKAWELLVRDNPLPAVHGRACYHPCEDACNRGSLDESVSIHGVELHLSCRAAAVRG